jgi:hypothetical protein
MTTLVTAPPAADLDFDTRLVLRAAEMTVRLDQAAVAFAINTAHLPGSDPRPLVVEPATLQLTPTLAPCPYNTTAGLLHRARARIETDGWCRDALFDESGAICPIRAIRLEAATRDQADDACVLLLEAIQRDFRDAETIPSWNAAQTSPAPVLLAFDRAATLAHNRDQ